MFSFTPRVFDSGVPSYSMYDLKAVEQLERERKADLHNWRLGGLFWAIVAGIFWVGCIW